MRGPGAKLKIMETSKPVVDIVRQNIEDITIASGRFGSRFSKPSMLGIDKKGITTKKPKALVELVMTKMAVKFKHKLYKKSLMELAGSDCLLNSE